MFAVFCEPRIQQMPSKITASPVKLFVKTRGSCHSWLSSFLNQHAKTLLIFITGGLECLNHGSQDKCEHPRHPRLYADALKTAKRSVSSSVHSQELWVREGYNSNFQFGDGRQSWNLILSCMNQVPATFYLITSCACICV